MSPPGVALAYDRLKVLYSVGKLLSSFETIESVFPKVLSLCAGTFPFMTGVLIEKSGKKVSTSAWYAENIELAYANRALENAKESFIYLTGASKADSLNLRTELTASQQLAGVFCKGKTAGKLDQNYLVLPLSVDRLSAYGIIQLEGATLLNESDLEFVEGLADLLAIAIDRNQKKKEVSAKLTRSQAHVLNLEAERIFAKNSLRC